jgi:ketosteroid isomerase-like protein
MFKTGVLATLRFLFAKNRDDERNGDFSPSCGPQPPDSREVLGDFAFFLLHPAILLYSAAPSQEEEQMRFAAAIAVAFLFVIPTFSQTGPCTESAVKSLIDKHDGKAVADDAYYFTGALDKPVVGNAAQDKAMKTIEASRQNVKTIPLRPERVVIAPSGDMAYEYGTGHMSFDESASGKHRDFTTAYLRVWRAVDGQCKIAAFMSEREGKENR